MEQTVIVQTPYREHSGHGLLPVELTIPSQDGYVRFDSKVVRTGLETLDGLGSVITVR